MFSFVTRTPRAPLAVRPRQVRLDLESLDPRNCPSGPPVITSLTAAIVSGHTVQLTGTVCDDNPGSCTIFFNGPVTDQTVADANGNFSYTGTIQQLGTEGAEAIDAQEWGSQNVQVQISAPQPTLSLHLAYGTRNNVILSGSVTAGTPGGLAVTFTGVVSGSATTNSDGSFQVTLPASGVGQIQATVTDIWGQTSAPASVTVAPPRRPSRASSRPRRAGPPGSSPARSPAGTSRGPRFSSAA